MKRNEIEYRVYDVIMDTLDVLPEQVHVKARWRDELGVDSLDVVELLIALEREFYIHVPDEDVESVVTIGDACEYIERMLKQQKRKNYEKE